MRIRIAPFTSVALALALVSSACVSKDTSASRSDTTTPATKSTTPAPAAPADTTASATTPTTSHASAAPATSTDTSRSAQTPTSANGLRVEVNLAARQLTLFDGNKVLEKHAVAVGSDKWPTQTGSWTIKQVIFNPEWIPPDETWAEERQPRKPGDPLNPLGHAQLVYDPPRTIHGTNQPSSIGKNVSHGSIRMNNAEIVPLAKRIMEATGAGKDAAWYQSAAKNRTEKRVVDLPHPIPIKVY